MNTLRNRRKKHGWTIAKLAKAFGISERTIYRWEAAEAPPIAHLAFDSLISAGKRQAEEKPGNV